mmetsp:Transcript_16940/g.48341  ORF Transcript_16940/g.48341 Transcript_16940/m.48341 type:complete len:267 (-) Transcript_16940:2132-2932(-)
MTKTTALASVTLTTKASPRSATRPQTNTPALPTGASSPGATLTLKTATSPSTHRPSSRSIISTFHTKRVATPTRSPTGSTTRTPSRMKTSLTLLSNTPLQTSAPLSMPCRKSTTTSGRRRASIVWNSSAPAPLLAAAQHAPTTTVGGPRSTRPKSTSSKALNLTLQPSHASTRSPLAAPTTRLKPRLHGLPVESTMTTHPWRTSTMEIKLLEQWSNGPRSSGAPLNSTRAYGHGTPRLQLALAMWSLWWTTAEACPGRTSTWPRKQ